jgi:hypothetical protein
MSIAKIKPVFMFFLFCLVPALGTNAATVSMLVIETGMPEESASEKTAAKTAESWETGMMDVFFEAGHIVSNAPAIRLSRPSDSVIPPEAGYDFDEADRGGADYFIILQVAYNAKTAKPDQILLCLYKIHPRSLVYDKKYGPDLAEYFPSAANLARTLIPYIKAG